MPGTEIPIDSFRSFMLLAIRTFMALILMRILWVGSTDSGLYKYDLAMQVESPVSITPAEPGALGCEPLEAAKRGR